MQSKVLGSLKIQVLRAELTHDVDVIARMDPYTVIACPSIHFREKTEVHKKGGKKPEWHDAHFKIDFTSESAMVEFDVSDWEKIGSDQHIGKGQQPIAELMKTNGEKKINLTWQKKNGDVKEAGTLFVRTRYSPNHKELLAEAEAKRHHVTEEIQSLQHAHQAQDTKDKAQLAALEAKHSAADRKLQEVKDHFEKERQRLAEEERVQSLEINEELARIDAETQKE